MYTRTRTRTTLEPGRLYIVRSAGLVAFRESSGIPDSIQVSARDRAQICQVNFPQGQIIMAVEEGTPPEEVRGYFGYGFWCLINEQRLWVQEASFSGLELLES